MQFIDDIRDGQLDQFLDEIISACNARRRLRTLADFQIGDSVKFNDLVSPKYLKGTVGTVSGHARTKVLVDFPATGRFGGNGVKCPPSILDPVAA